MNTVTPEEVGLSASRLSRIGVWMQGYVDQSKLAGLIAMVARYGKVVRLERCGMMDLEAATPMQFDTIFRIYSMTRPITTVALMMLCQEGLFQLDDPVSKFILEFADVKVFSGTTEEGFELDEPEREIAIWHLLTHTASLGYAFTEDSPVESMYREAGMFEGPLYLLQLALQEMILRLVRLPLIYQPGTASRYSVATDVLGYLVEVISEMPLDAFLEESIFKPLGMEDTGFYVPEAKLGRIAAMYGPAENSGFELLDAPATSPFSKPTVCLSGLSR